MQEGVEVSAKTVDEAIDKGLEQLGLRRHEVRVVELAPGKPGLFGLGGEDARVRLIPLNEAEIEARVRAARFEPTPAELDEDEDELQPSFDDDELEPSFDGDEPQPSFDADSEVPSYEPENESDLEVHNIEAPEVLRAAEHLRELLQLLAIEADVQVRAPRTPGDGKGRASAVLDITGDDLALLIGRRGTTLAALQYLVNVVANRQGDGKIMLTVDIEGYRRRREDSLTSLAYRMASRVRQSGRPISLEPMPPNERRIVHMALAENAAVSTASIGEGERRKVVISPRRREGGGPPRRY
ncbi:MAG TPA: RNA-binding cell elongation regulator Jag/EloR [Dehalococcoidia bacterium]|nr:RNA-binding cell elongation regulator Jag/EloR [Dehalococcoidia bacterium]